MPKKINNKTLTAADIARVWNLTPGRISQFVRDGMPTDTLEVARLWRRECWDIDKSGPLPDYLLTRHERLSLEQCVYDTLVYRYQVKPAIASAVCFNEIYCRRGDNRRPCLLMSGRDRGLTFKGEHYSEGTWFWPAEAVENPEDNLGLRKADVAKFLEAAACADAVALLREPGFLRSEDDSKEKQK